jgi:hypothetical protein
MNRQIYPQVLSPLMGDAISTPGSNLVTVVGIQTTPVVRPASFRGGEVIEYNINTGFYTPILRACIQVNNLTVSDDYDIAINQITGLLVNGTGTF